MQLMPALCLLWLRSAAPPLRVTRGPAASALPAVGLALTLCKCSAEPARWSGNPFAGVRVGEASHPGPEAPKGLDLGWLSFLGPGLLDSIKQAIQSLVQQARRRLKAKSRKAVANKRAAGVELRQQDWDSEIVRYEVLASKLEASQGTFKAVIRCGKGQLSTARTLLQGSGKPHSVLLIEFCKDAPKDTSKEEPSPSSKAVRQRVPEFATAEVWKKFGSAPRDAIAHWAATSRVHIVDAFKWSEEVLPGNKRQVYGVIRVPEPDAPALLVQSGAGGVFISVPKAAASSQYVQWIPRNTSEPSAAYLARAFCAKGSLSLGLVFRGSNLGSRHHADAKTLIPRIWILEGLPSILDMEQAKTVLEPLFRDLSIIRQVRKNGSKQFIFRGACLRGNETDLVKAHGAQASHVAWARLAPPKGENGSANDATGKPQPAAKRQKALLRQVPEGTKLMPQDKDGNCMYRSIACALNHGRKEASFHHLELRARVASHLEEHGSWYEEEWKADNCKGPDGTPLPNWAAFVAAVAKPGSFSGDIELKALCKLCKIKVVLIPEDPAFAVVAYSKKWHSKTHCVFYTSNHFDYLAPVGDAYSKELLDVSADPNGGFLVGGLSELATESSSSRCAGTRAADLRTETSRRSKGRSGVTPVTRQAAGARLGPKKLRASGSALCPRPFRVLLSLKRQVWLPEPPPELAVLDGFVEPRKRPTKIRCRSSTPSAAFAPGPASAVTTTRLPACKNSTLSSTTLASLPLDSARVCAVPSSAWCATLAKLRRGGGVRCVPRASTLTLATPRRVRASCRPFASTKPLKWAKLSCRDRAEKATVTRFNASSAALISQKAHLLAKFEVFRWPRKEHAATNCPNKAASGLLKTWAHGEAKARGIALFDQALAFNAASRGVSCGAALRPILVRHSFDLVAISEAHIPAASRVAFAAEWKRYGWSVVFSAPEKQYCQVCLLSQIPLKQVSVCSQDGATRHAAALLDLKSARGNAQASDILAGAQSSGRRCLVFGDWPCSVQLRFSPGVLKAAMQSMHGKAAGADDWRPSEMIHLPWSWWDLASQLWSTIVEVRRVPCIWKQARVALLWKARQRTRPISLLPAAGARCIKDQLKPWLDSWQESHVMGGLPATSVATSLMQIRRAFDEGCSCFAQLDIASYFDTIGPFVLRRRMAHLHLPQDISDLLGNFYQGVQRIFCMSQALSGRWREISTGLAQGCPLSPILASAIGHIWCCWIKASRPPDMPRCLSYVDDRTLWVPAGGPCSALQLPLRRSREFDQAFGFALSLDKSAIVTRDPDPCADALAAEFGFKRAATLEILGVQASFESEWRLLKFQVLRLNLLRTVTSNRRTHCQLLASLVTPCFAWAAGFARPAPEELSKVRGAVVHLFGKCFTGQAATVLVFEATGWKLEPEFACESPPCPLALLRSDAGLVGHSADFAGHV
ncbi:Pol [Symbiodinium sp. CCMP2456]|nr:Pol [Symbiodinium sp. CCMP2456]